MGGIVARLCACVKAAVLISRLYRSDSADVGSTIWKIGSLGRKAGLCGLFVMQMVTASASAGTSPQLDTATIAATVLDDCSVAGAVGPANWTLDFGTYQLGSSAAVNFATFLYCTKGTIVSSITLDNGLHYFGASRHLDDAASHSVPYKIFTTGCASRALEWIGAATPSAFAGVASTSVHTALASSACGTIDAGSNAPAGSYNDTVTLTVNFT
jgi:spore coat protein U-like protein